MTLTRADLDTLQTMIAEKLAENPGDIKVVTEQVVRDRIKYEGKRALEELRRIGPENDADETAFSAKVTIFGPRGEVGTVPCGFNQRTKHPMMQAVSEVCKTVFAQALILQTAGTFADVPTLGKHMNLNVPDPRDRQKMDYFEEKMWAWIKSNYGEPRIAKLPPHLRYDCIMFFAMGPKVPIIGGAIQYRWENGVLVSSDKPMDGMGVQSSLIPRWWQ